MVLDILLIAKGLALITKFILAHEAVIISSGLAAKVGLALFTSVKVLGLSAAVIAAIKVACGVGFVTGG